MSSNFNFYLNRQGPKGRKGDRGEQGYSPSISVETETAAEYILKIQNEGYSFTTPNLRGNAIENTGGTYIRFNPETEAWYTGTLDSASPTQLGGVLITPVGGIESGGSDMDVPTSAEIYDYVESKITSIGEGYVREDDFADAMEQIASELDGKMSFDNLASSLVEGDNITLDVDSENGTITINATGADLSSCVKTTGDQNISGYKTFLNSPILKGTTNSTLEFDNGNDDTEVAKLQYTFSTNRFTISSEGGMYLQTANNSINVDDLITSSALTNVVTTNTSQNISGLKTFANQISIKEGNSNPSLSFFNISNQQRANIYYDTATNKLFLYSSGDLVLQDGNTSRSLSTIQQTTNLVTSISGASTHTQYPSAKCVYDVIGDIESTLDAIIAGGNNTVALTVVLSGNPQYLTSLTFDGNTYSLSDFTNTGSSYDMTLQISPNVNHSWSVSATHGATPSSGTVNVNSNSTLNITVNGAGSDSPI